MLAGNQENIEISQTKTHSLTFSSLPYEEKTITNGEHVIRVKTLGPKEFFMLQLLSYKTAPAVLYVRSKDGPAEEIQIRPQKIFPLWFQVISGGLFCVGLGFAILLVIKAIMFISKNSASCKEPIDRGETK